MPGVEIFSRIATEWNGEGGPRIRPSKFIAKTFVIFHFAIHHLRMAQAIMNPEEVRRFAQELKRFNTDMQQRFTSLQSRFSALGETWQDAEHDKFANEFTTTMKAIKHFIEMSEQHTPFLLRKAQRIEDYLNQR
jgi:uncharacterized protein YukE